MRTVSDLIAETLRDEGVEHFFQLTGGDQALWIALERAGIRMVNCRSEPGATYMADGYARNGARVALTYGQHGPGALNVAGSLADAFWAQTPLVALASTVPASLPQGFGYQQVDQLASFEPVTVWSGEASSNGDAVPMLRAAIRAALTAPGGPAYLGVPRTVLAAPSSSNGDSGNLAAETSARGVAAPASPSPTSVLAASEVVQSLWRALSEADRPVILAGRGVVRSFATDELDALLRSLELPIATTLGGKGARSENDPLSLGTIGRYGCRVANELVREADLVVVLGSRLGELSTDGGTTPTQEVRILHVERDESVIARTYPQVEGVMLDLDDALRRLRAISEVEGPLARHDAWRRDVTARVHEWRSSRDDYLHRASSMHPMHPATVTHTLRSLMATDDVLVVDTGYMAAWTSVFYPVRAPGTYLRASGSLGWALPASIGASLASSAHRVVCVTGDGGAGYHIMELETAVRYGVPVVIVVLNNGGLAFEYHLQKHREHHVVGEVNTFGACDYGAVARSLGAGGVTVDTADGLKRALRDAFDSGGAALIDAHVDIEAVPPLPMYDALGVRS